MRFRMRFEGEECTDKRLGPMSHLLQPGAHNEKGDSLQIYKAQRNVILCIVASLLYWPQDINLQPMLLLGCYWAGERGDGVSSLSNNSLSTSQVPQDKVLQETGMDLLKLDMLLRWKEVSFVMRSLSLTTP